MTDIKDSDFFGLEKHEKRDENLFEHEFNPPATPSAIERATGPYNRMMSFPGTNERKRVRTESLCSNKSTAITKDLQKIRRLDDFGGKNVSRQPNRADILKKDKAHLTMKDMIYYNPTTNPMSRQQDKSAKKEVVVKEEGVKEERVKTPEPPKQSAPLVPQLKLGPNGEMILDEQSLVVQSTAEREAQRVLQNAEVVYEDGNNGRYGYFKRQKRTKDWSPEETIKFYRCLHTVGTDFSLMLQLFPKRTRRELKIKFKKEEKNNGHLIDKAILYPKEFDIDALKRELEEEEEEMIRKEQEARIRLEEENQLRKKLCSSRNEELRAQRRNAPQRWLSKASRSMVEADLVYKAADLEVGRHKRRRKRQALTNTVPVENRYEQKKEDIDEDDLSSPTMVETTVMTENESEVEEMDSQAIKIEPEPLESTQNYSQESDLLSDGFVQEDSDDGPEIKPSIVKLESAEPSQTVAGEDNKLDIDDVDLDSLVLCTVLDTKGEVTYQVFMQDPVTGELGDQPLDLAQDIIDILKQNVAEK